MALATRASLFPIPGLAHLQLALCNVHHKHVLAFNRGSAQSRKQTHKRMVFLEAGNMDMLG